MLSRQTIAYANGNLELADCEYSAVAQTGYMAMFLFDGESLTVEAVDAEARADFIKAWVMAGGEYVEESIWTR